MEPTPTRGRKRVADDDTYGDAPLLSLPTTKSVRLEKKKAGEAETPPVEEETGIAPSLQEEDLSPPPHIDKWSLVSGKASGPFQAPECAPTVLSGCVSNHPHFPDGDLIWSSPVVWLDYGQCQMAQTNSRRYTLGAIDPDFLDFLKGRKDSISVAISSMDMSTTRRCRPNGPC